MRSNRVNMDTEWATESVRIKRVELCSSRKYPYPSSPPPPPTRKATEIQREGGGPRRTQFPMGWWGEWLLRFFSVSPSKTGELSKTNRRTAEQALSHFTADDLLKQELLFSSTIFY